MSVFPYADLQYSILNFDGDDDNDVPGNPLNPRGKQKAHKTQLVISASLGLVAFLLFCFSRPRWDKLYAARKRRLREGTDTNTGSPGSYPDEELIIVPAASLLPDLPKGFFSWIPVLYNITEHQVLASAGLDAFVFLGFFKMAIQFLLIAAVFGAAVLLPLHKHYGPNTGRKLPGYPGHDSSIPGSGGSGKIILSKRSAEKELVDDTTYLWAYVFFVWLFSLVCIRLLVLQTEKVVKVRQEYLGTHCTATDRTIRLSGIPEQDRDPQTIKKYVENFGVGEVETVMICKNWARIDELMDKRDKLLRKLEEAYTILLKKRAKAGVVLPITRQPRPARDEVHESLLPDQSDWDQEGPTLRIWQWQGMFKLRTKKVDAVRHYTEELEKMDEKIKIAREQDYPATACAFVTMKSAASAQMAVQTLLDPEPHHYTTHLAPAPKDIVWKNIYMSKRERMFRAWTISICISLLTIIWLFPVSILAAFLNLKSIAQFFPRLAKYLENSQFIGSLVQNFAPTLILTLLNVAIPYLYDYLSEFQGMISQSDIELSVISKNFFFTFFNLFFAFSVFGTASNMYSVIKDSLHDTTKIAFQLAGSLEEMAPFYVNLIILQGIGMFPVRLLDFGSVFLYPFQRATAKTARDRYEIERPPVFKYGFYLPQPILILILCIIYSVMPSGGLILLFGLIYFIMGYFTFKYQLLYAMSHNVHSTGKAWPLISYRIIVGLLLFQMAMAALLAARKAFYRALMVFPMLLFTVWFAWYFRAVYAPLTEFVALKAIKIREGDMSPEENEDHPAEYQIQALGRQWDGEVSVEQRVPHRSRKFEELAEGTVFTHPGIIAALEPFDANKIEREVEEEGYRFNRH